MSGNFVHLKNLVVIVEQVVYVPNVSSSLDKPFGFVYFLSIENNTPHTIKLLARKWIVREESSATIVVEGEGIVGEKPTIEPGDSFSYNSCHVVGSNAIAEGAFFGLIENDNRRLVILIPKFDLILP